MMHKTIN